MKAPGKKLLLLALAATPLVLGLGFAVQYELDRRNCKNTAVREEKSPNGKYRAAYFTRQCSGEELFHHLSIFDAEPSILDPRTGNLLIHHQPIEFRWKSDEQLEVVGMPFLWQVTPTFYGIQVEYLGDRQDSP